MKTDRRKYKNALRAYVLAIMQLEIAGNSDDRKQFEKAYAQAKEARKAYQVAKEGLLQKAAAVS